VNGTAYDIDEEIPDDDPCVTCTCTEHGEICAAIGCAFPNCRCGLQPIAREDECCPSCRCVVNGTAYDIDEEIPDDDPCVTCTCTEHGEICAAIGCAFPNCRCGLQPIAREDECCPSCRCVVNGTAYDIDEEIPDDDPCVTW
jgi:DNA-binding IclR family transcriptional regulator